MSPQVRVAGLAIHPVKGCAAVAVDRIEVGPHGPVGDRTWQVTGDDGGPVTQRQAPEMVLIRPEVVDDGGLVLRAPGADPLSVPPPRIADTPVRSYSGIPVRLADAGDAAASWLSDVLARPCRLHGIAPGYSRRMPGPAGLWTHDVSLVDAAPMLLANQASLVDLLDDAVEPFDMARFRPNVVVEGAEPWEEDRWRALRIGGVEVRILLPWPRCPVPQVDQRTGERRREPALVLKRRRWCAGADDLAGVPDEVGPLLAGTTMFGVACDIGPLGATVERGAAVEVVAAGPPMVRPRPGGAGSGGAGVSAPG